MVQIGTVTIETQPGAVPGVGHLGDRTAHIDVNEVRTGDFMGQGGPLLHGDRVAAEAPQDAVRILRYTGADIAMIGRGVFGNPWLFAQCKAALSSIPRGARP